MVCWWWWSEWSFARFKSSSCHHCHFHHISLQQNPEWFDILT